MLILLQVLANKKRATANKTQPQDDKTLTEDTEDLCPNCKFSKKDCVDGQAVLFIRPMGRHIGCRVVTHGPHYWSEKNRGLVATVVDALDFETVLVRWEVGWGKGTRRKNVGSLTTYKLFSTLENAKKKSLFKFSCS